MFRILGFNVQVQSGFVIFMALIVAINPNEFGVWLAAAIAVLTLVHELGHAIEARRAGADAEISLGFLAGYASYRPTRPISRARHAWISFSGPGLHIAVSLVVLYTMGVDPLDIRAHDDNAAAFAIWWAGPVIGAINLIPVLPLDGGNIVLQGLDRVVPAHARRWMLYFSMGATATGAVWMFATGWQGFAIFVAFLLLAQFQMLNALRGRPNVASAWEIAAAALADGKRAKAERTLVAALRHPQPIPPSAQLRLTREQADELIDLLPDPLPHGDPGNEYVLANLLLTTGRFAAAADYAAGSYGRHPNTLSALIVARSAGALGDDATARAWLRAADEGATAPPALAHAIDNAPELATVKAHPEVVALRRSLPA